MNPPTYLILLASALCVLSMSSCSSTVQVLQKDPLVGDRIITAAGRSVSIASDPNREGAVRVQVGGRDLVIERDRLVVAGEKVASLDSRVQEIGVRADCLGRLSVRADGRRLWSE